MAFCLQGQTWVRWKLKKKKSDFWTAKWSLCEFFPFYFMQCLLHFIILYAWSTSVMLISSLNLSGINPVRLDNTIFKIIKCARQLNHTLLLWCLLPSLRLQTSSLDPPRWCVIIYLTLLDVPGRNSWCLVNRSLSSVISDTVDSGH